MRCAVTLLPNKMSLAPPPPTRLRVPVERRACASGAQDTLGPLFPARPALLVSLLSKCLLADADSPRRARASTLGAHARRGHGGLGGPNGESITLEAPPIAEFQQVFRHVRAGQSLRPGLEGVGSRERANKLRWSLSEALREKDAKFVINEAHCLWIARDSKQSRLLFRLRAISFQKRHLTVRAGTLGQTQSFGTGAASIVLATNHVLRRFLTAGLNKPEKNSAGPGASNAQQREKLSARPPPTPI